MANSYRVLRTFPSNTPVWKGKVLDDPKFRNLALLVKQGYLQPIEDEIPSRARKNEVSKPDKPEMDNNSDLEMTEVDRPHVDHPKKTTEALAGPAGGETDVEVVAEGVGSEAFIPDEVANSKKPAARAPAVKTKAKEKKNAK